MKRFLVIILIILVAVVGGYVYFSKDTIAFTKETSAYKAVPVSSPLFFEISALKSLPFENPLIQQFIGSTKSNLFASVQNLDSLIKSNHDIQSGLRNEPLILAFDWVGENQLYPLIIKKAGSSNKQKSIEKIVDVLFNKNQSNKTIKKYSGYSITTIKNPQGKEKFTYSFVGGLFLGSTKLILVEECIRQLNRQSILENNYFTQVNKTASIQSNISCYINHLYFPEVIGNWLNSGTTKMVNEFGKTIAINHKKNILSLKKMASWTELDINFDNNLVALNGISAASDSLNQFLSVFRGQQPVRFKAEEALPKNTAYFTSYSFSNKESFFENLQNFFVHSDFYYKREEYFKNISRTIADFNQSLVGIVDNEIVVAYAGIASTSDDKTTYFVLHTKGKTQAENFLNNVITSYAKRKKADASTFKRLYNVDAETSFTIYKFPYYSLPYYWLGKPFSQCEARYAAFNGNYLVFGNSQKGLQNYLHDMVIESTLEKDIRYQEFKQNTASKANITNYVNINRLFSLYPRFFNAESAKTITKNEEFLAKFYAASWQVVCDNNIYFNSLNIQQGSTDFRDAKTVWQSNVGGKIISKPQIVKNHNDVNNNEVIVQDDRYLLHQITKEGRVRWSVPVGEPIISKIFQVDGLKNGKLQYVFNTKSKLFLVDRNGNNVGNFPVKFRSPATNGINVFDYDHNRNYRFFVAAKNRKVYVFDRAGKIVTGWKFGQTDHVVTTPIEHFRVNNKDYIVFKDKSRIYIQNRKGETRVKVQANFNNSRNRLILNTSGVPKIITTDISGNVYYIYFNGKSVLQKKGNYGANHYFIASDLDGNNTPDFVFVDDNKLEVFDENGKRLFHKKFKNTITLKPTIFSFSANQRKVGIVDSKANQIFLFDSEGELHNGFPLQGNSEFSIGKMAKNATQLNLIVGSEGGDLFNYTLE